MEAAVTLDHSLVAVETETDVHALLELGAPEATAGARAPLSIALVLDRSGSMQGHRLATVKQAASFLVGQLGPEDRAAVITYDDHVDLLAPLAPVDAAGLRGVLAGVASGGTTNLSGGWLKGVEQLKSGDGARRVLLLTDGLANVGITDPVKLAGSARSAAAEGVGTSCLGVGEGFNEDLLSSMARSAGGNYHWIENADDAPAVFAEEFGELVALFAQNVSVEIRPHEAVAVLGVLNEFPTVPVAGGVQVQLPDAYAGQVLRLVVRIHVPALASLGAVKLADLVLRYTTVGDEVALHETTIPVFANAVSAEDAAGSVPDARVTDEVTVLNAARATDEAMRLADQGQFDEARDLLTAAIDDLEGRASTSAKADELRTQAQRLRSSQDTLSAAGFTSASRKHLHHDIYASRSRRERRDRDPDG